MEKTATVKVSKADAKVAKEVAKRPISWVCDQCGTENAYRFGFCQKCFKARSNLKIKLKEITPKKKIANHQINLKAAPLTETVGIAAAVNPDAKPVVKKQKARPNSWVCVHCGTANANTVNYCANCYRTK